MKVYHIFMKIKNKDVGFTTFLYVIFPTSLLYHLHYVRYRDEKYECIKEECVIFDDC